jgi:hypothetical protein
MFTKKDIQQIEKKGTTLDHVEKQIAYFKKGFPFADLQKPAVKNDGITVFSEKRINELVRFFEKNKDLYRIVKFVPASGAASRMFKELFHFLETVNRGEQAALLQSATGFNSISNFIERLKDFAFYPELETIMGRDGITVEECLNNKDYYTLIDYVVNARGLDYGSLPKGLLDFHSYEGKGRKPLEEHLVEAAMYATDAGGFARVHFTVSPEHLDNFSKTLEKVRDQYEKTYEVKFEVSFSIQKPSTDTIAVGLDNNPFREPDGSLLFRPGGHGALIENLNELEGDVVFIKNIDNVVPDRLKPETTRYKKAIGGLLTSLREQAFDYLRRMESGNVDPEILEDIRFYAENDLNINIPESYNYMGDPDKAAFLFKNLNRPIRVCGMVKNEGEPGGGPFWVKNSKGEISLQIVESSQINQSDPHQRDIVNAATHFNPVDLVCGLTDYKNNRFDLHQFIDPETGFISVKSKAGKNLKAQELPGLWNGAMADWITIFVEVPIITFNPVKTVNDLLRDQHQPA